MTKTAPITAIERANRELAAADLPRYDELIDLLSATENKLKSMRSYHSGRSAIAIDGLCNKLAAVFDRLPYP